ncbi:hypothetical protein ACXWOQ_10390, partial [Streptococcus pyogenes]
FYEGYAFGKSMPGTMARAELGGQRFEHLRNQFVALLEYYEPDVIFYEGYAFGKSMPGTMARAELGGQRF